MPFLNPLRPIPLLLLASLMVLAPQPSAAASGVGYGASMPANSTPASSVQTDSGQANSASPNSVRQLYRQRRWSDVVAAVPLPARGQPIPPADLLLLRSFALAQLSRLADSAQTLRIAARAYPRDARFPTELAGVLYRQKHYAEAARLLRRALRLSPRDDYARNFLGTVDFLQGNLDAALADWNPIARPVLDDQQIVPAPSLPPLLLDRIFPFSPGSVYTLRQYRVTQAQLALQPLFAAVSDELQPQPDGHFRLIVHTIPHPGWRTAPVANLLSTLRSLPYQAVDPEFWNLRHSAVSLVTYLRWDAQKRMITAQLGSPIRSPDQRLHLDLDARNENWNLTRTLTANASIVPVATLQPALLNQERIRAGIGLDELFGSRLLWQTSVGFSRRRFRSLLGVPAASPYFYNTSAVGLRSSLRAVLVDSPIHRFDLASTLAVQAHHYFTRPLNRSVRLSAALDAHWLPASSGDRYRLHTLLRAGDTFGQIPFDQLWMLGFDRDNPLWMRGHNGLINGRKGNAPLGARYLLANTDFDHLLWRDPFVSVRFGPFVDTGRIYASDEGSASGTSGPLFGAPRWLTDTGLQARLHLFTSSTLVLGWGHDLRSGSNTFYSAISH